MSIVEVVVVFEKNVNNTIDRIQCNVILEYIDAENAISL